MKKLFLILAIAFISASGYTQGNGTQPATAGINNSLIPSFIPSGDSMIKIFTDWRKVAVVPYAMALKKKDSTSGGFYPWSNPLNFIPKPVLPTNNLAYWNGSTFDTTSITYIKATDRTCFGCIVSLIDPFALDSAKKLIMYNTRVDHTTNFQKYAQGYSSASLYKIALTNGGSGSIASYQILATATRQININANSIDITGLHNFQTGANSTNGASMWGISGSEWTGSASSGKQYGMSMFFKSSMSGATAGYHALHVEVFENTVGGGTNKLLEAGTGSLVDGSGTFTEKFGITNAGLFALNNVTPTANQFPGANSGATAMEWKSFAAGSGITITHTTNTVTIAAAALAGTNFSNAAAFSVLGNATGSSAGPTFTANPIVSSITGKNSTTNQIVAANITGSGSATLGYADANTANVLQMLQPVAGTYPISAAGADLTSQSAVGNITTYTTTATGSFRVGGYVAITAIATDVLQLEVTWTDENSTSQTQLFYPLGLTSANLNSTGFYAFPTCDIRVKTGTVITVKTILAVGAGTVTFDAGGTIGSLR